jgi:hypothetical protein
VPLLHPTIARAVMTRAARSHVENMHVIEVSCDVLPSRATKTRDAFLL